MWLEAELSYTSDNKFVSASSSSAFNASRKGKRPHFERKLGAFFKFQIELNTYLFMEMDLGQVGEQCASMVYNGPFTISG